MGETLSVYHPISMISDRDDINIHHNRRDLRPSPYKHDQFREYRIFLHNWKNSKSEIWFFTYRFLAGGFIGALVGLAVHPFLRFSPYVFRKFLLSFKSDAMLPTTSVRNLVGTLPYYFVYGGFGMVGTTFLSELYDRVFSSSMLTKYSILGTVYGMIFPVFFGATSSWINGGIFGLLLGMTACGLKLFPSYDNTAGRTNAVEYMSHVTEEQKRKYELEEARIMGFKNR